MLDDLPYIVSGDTKVARVSDNDRAGAGSPGEFDEPLIRIVCDDVSEAIVPVDNSRCWRCLFEREFRRRVERAVFEAA